MTLFVPEVPDVKYVLDICIQVTGSPGSVLAPATEDLVAAFPCVMGSSLRSTFGLAAAASASSTYTSNKV
jgi:hypothetical protein